MRYRRTGRGAGDGNIVSPTVETWRRAVVRLPSERLRRGRGKLDSNQTPAANHALQANDTLCSPSTYGTTAQLHSRRKPATPQRSSCSFSLKHSDSPNRFLLNNCESLFVPQATCPSTPFTSSTATVSSLKLNRHCDFLTLVAAECIYTKRWAPAAVQRNSSTNALSNGDVPAITRKALTAEDDAKLIFGTVFSLRRIVRQLGGDDDSFLSYRTGEYKMHYFETPTQLKFVMLTDTRVGNMRTVLHQIWATLYVEYVIKNPLSPLEHPKGVGVSNQLFEGGLESFIVSPGRAKYLKRILTLFQNTIFSPQS